MVELGKFLKSRKFLFIAIVLGVFLTLVLTGTMVVTSEQTIEFLKWILAFSVGAHTATDISAVIGQFFGKSDSIVISTSEEEK